MMSKRTKELRYNAMTNAAQMIEEHGQNGGDPDDYGCESEDDLELYKKQCKHVAEQLFRQAEKYRAKHNLP